jgi:23S rRNA pseudouridine2605 synthase
MLERLQKIISRAGIASRRHAEQLISSGQVLVNGKVVTELGSKADPAKDKIEAAGRTLDTEERRHVYLLLNKPPEIVSTLADPEGRKNLRNLLRGFPERVYPVGNLEYAAAGLVFMTNDGDLAAAMQKKWNSLEQIYHVKVKGMLTLPDLERLSNDTRIRMQTLRQPDSARGHAQNFWYEVRMSGGKLDDLRYALLKENHPIEKVKRVALGPLSLEGIPRGHYRLIEKKDAEELLLDRKPVNLQFTKSAKPYTKPSKPFVKPPRTHTTPPQKHSARKKFSNDKFAKNKFSRDASPNKSSFNKFPRDNRQQRGATFNKFSKPQDNRPFEDDDVDEARPVHMAPWLRPQPPTPSKPSGAPPKRFSKFSKSRPSKFSKTSAGRPNNFSKPRNGKPHKSNKSHSEFNPGNRNRPR